MQSEHVKLQMIDALVENSLTWRESFSRRKEKPFSEHMIVRRLYNKKHLVFYRLTNVSLDGLFT